MQPKLKLNINKPCHENWQNMNPSEQGRFCNACAKEVVDFTEMTDTEVLYYFIGKKKEDVCGRLYTDQLNRDIVKPVYTNQKKKWYWNYLAMVFIFLFKGNAGKSQEVKPLPSEQLSNNNIDRGLSGKLGKVSVIESSSFEVSGKITDNNGNPIANATILIKGSRHGTATDSTSNYQLKDVRRGNILVVSCVGFQTQEQKVNAGKNDIVLQLKDNLLTGEVIIMGGIGSDYSYEESVRENHVAEIEILDKNTNEPIKAGLSIQLDGSDEATESTSDKKGKYKLRQIRESDKYIIKIAAVGYKESKLIIKGCDFSKRKETRFVFLEKDIKPVTDVRGQTQISMGGISSAISVETPLYIVDGILVENIDNLNPIEIESIDILKDASSSAIHSYRSSRTVIVITTKKKKDVVVNKITDSTKNVHLKKVNPEILVISNFKILPNPVVKGSSFAVSFSVKKGGEYSLQVVNAAGIIMHSQKIMTNQNNNTLQLASKDNWVSGVYFITILDAANNPISTGNLLIR